MACPSYFIVHSPHTRNAPTYTNLEWLLHRLLSFTVRAHTTLRRIQNLNGLSIIFYRSHSAHTQRSDVYIDYRQVWGSLRLAPNIVKLNVRHLGCKHGFLSIQYSKPPIKNITNCIFRMNHQIFDLPIILHIQYTYAVILNFVVFPVLHFHPLMFPLSQYIP